MNIDRLFRDFFENEFQIGERQELRLPFCTIQISIAASDPFPVSRLNLCFPNSPPTIRSEAPVRIVVLDDTVDEEAWASLFENREQHCSADVGRGAFPVRWAPSSVDQPIWIAEYRQVRHKILRRGADLCILLDPGDPDRIRYVQRVLREVLIHLGRMRGFLVVHAAVVSVVNIYGVVFLGSQGQGKTDIALRACREFAGSPVTVDRGLLGCDERGALIAIGLPFGMNIFAKTFECIGVSEAAARGLGRYDLGKIYLDIQDFVDLAGIKPEGMCPVTAVVILSGSNTRPVGSTELEEAFKGSLLYETDPGYRHDWLGMAGDPSTLTPQCEIVRDWPLSALAENSLVLKHDPGGSLPKALWDLMPTR